jgi:NAD(P)H-dependent flavin oxidoreductase YrpB (nitropropane dioxygenase family)
MGPDLTGPKFVAAVSKARGLSILQAQLAPPNQFRAEIRRVRELTNKPFGVNLILHFPVKEPIVPAGTAQCQLDLGLALRYRLSLRQFPQRRAPMSVFASQLRRISRCPSIS